MLWEIVSPIDSPPPTASRKCAVRSHDWKNQWSWRRISKGICFRECDRNLSTTRMRRRKKRNALRWRRRKPSLITRSERWWHAIRSVINFDEIFFYPSHDIESPAKKASAEPHKNDLSEDADKKKKKRSQKRTELSNLINDDAPMSEGYMGGRMSNECPLLDGIEKKCRGIDIMTGDSHQNLLEACGAHQLCYLCVSSSLALSIWVMLDYHHYCTLIGRFAAAVRLRVFDRSWRGLRSWLEVQTCRSSIADRLAELGRSENRTTRMHQEPMLEHGTALHRRLNYFLDA